MKKQYLNGYNYEVHGKTLLKPSMLVLTNELPFGKGRLEAHILIEKGEVRMLITDGYKYMYDKTGFRGVKAAMNIAHSKMVAGL
jgi:hypothetical protein